MQRGYQEGIRMLKLVKKVASEPTNGHWRIFLQCRLAGIPVALR